MRVLVVDDEENVRKGISTFLELSGYAVLGVGDLRAAREALMRDPRPPFGAALVDVYIGEEDGSALLDFVSERSLAAPVIMMSGKSRVRDAVAAVRKGVVFPRPAAHDDKDCPFHPVAEHPRQRVVDVLERVARRDALEVVVTLCHLPEAARQELWDGLSPDTRALLLPRLEEVHLMSSTRTREYARDMLARLTRSARQGHTTRRK